MDRLTLILLLTNSLLYHVAKVNADKQLCDKEVEGNGVVHISVSSNTNCVPTYSCKELGGHCFTSGSKCNGKIDAYGCTGAGMRCMCCIPDDSCPGICPHHISPICAVMNNESKLETFSNEECFKEKVLCDPAFANYTFKHFGQCDDPLTTEYTTKPSTTLFPTTKVQSTVAPTTTEVTTKDDPITTGFTTKPPTTLYPTTKAPSTVAPTTTEVTTKVYEAGPTGMLWGGNQCLESGPSESGSLDFCKDRCNRYPKCTAFNFMPGDHSKCEFRDCSIPVPSPTWNYGNGWIGYYRKYEGTMCSDPWFSVGEQCFRVFESERRNWAAARTYCQSLTAGGDLATPNNIEALAGAMLDKGHDDRTAYWLGGTDAAVEGEWRWYDNRPMPSDNWFGAEGGADHEDCVVILPDKGAKSLFDFTCGSAQAFICQA